MDKVYVVTQFIAESHRPDSYTVRRVFDDKESAIRFVNKRTENSYDEYKNIGYKFTKYKKREIYVEYAVQEMTVKKRRIVKFEELPVKIH